MSDHISLIKIALEAAQKSTCLRRKVGCILISVDGNIVAQSNGGTYNGETCESIGCLRAKGNIKSGTMMEKCHGLHAEQKVIAVCARKGIPTLGSSVYITLCPCKTCSKTLIEAGVKHIYFISDDYPDKDYQKLFDSNKIEYHKMVI